MPYTYLLHHKPTNTFYYGVRWAMGCDPSEFWKTYFTSSKHVRILRSLFGDNSFEFEIRRRFLNEENAREWEHKVLRRLSVLKKQDTWINKTDNKSIFNKHGPNLGKTLPHMKGTSYGKKNKGRISPTKNMIWVTNGIEEKMIRRDEVVPINWVVGRNEAHKATSSKLKMHHTKLIRENGKFTNVRKRDANQ